MSNHLLRSTPAMLATLVALPLSLAWACPFCSAVSQTLSEEMKTADAAVITSHHSWSRRATSAAAWASARCATEDTTVLTTGSASRCGPARSRKAAGTSPKSLI